MGFFPSQRSGEEPGIYSRMVGQRFRTRMLPVFQSECTAWKGYLGVDFHGEIRFVLKAARGRVIRKQSAINAQPKQRRRSSQRLIF
jgi:hypothetical protein